MAKYQNKFFTRNGPDPVSFRRNQKDFHKGINDKHAKQKEYRSNADKKRRFPEKNLQFRSQPGMFVTRIFSFIVTPYFMICEVVPVFLKEKYTSAGKRRHIFIIHQSAKNSSQFSAYPRRL